MQVQDPAEKVPHRYLNGVIKRLPLSACSDSWNIYHAFPRIYMQIALNVTQLSYLCLKLGLDKERRKCLQQQMETFCDIAEHSGTKVCRKFICSSSGIPVI